MHLPTGNYALGTLYKSASQRARVITEAWMSEYGYCLACEGDRLVPTKSNTQARDFECDCCGHPYELKSALSPFRRRVIGGAYESMMRRINSSTVPSILLMQYSPTWSVISLKAIHHSLITSVAIEQRKPLSVSARRAGWIGCNIMLDQIPPEGQIKLVSDGIAFSKKECRRHFASTEKLSKLSAPMRGWAASVLTLLHGVGSPYFTLQDAYAFEQSLAEIYPRNKNIRPKIRQQLQVLRDAGILIFEARGSYRFSNIDHNGAFDE